MNYKHQLLYSPSRTGSITVFFGVTPWILKKIGISDDTIEDMREEKVIMDFPEAAEKILAANKEVLAHSKLILSFERPS